MLQAQAKLEEDRRPRGEVRKSIHLYTGRRRDV
jgi:hypothetical protein